MSAPSEETGARRGSDASAEELYDAYLDAVLEGADEDPDVFLERHGVDDATLAESLRAVHAEAAGAGDPVVARPGELRPGARFDDFTLVRKLGEGGMGVVWLARQESLGREVALKLIRSEYASSPIAARRFEREAKTIAKLLHPNIVGVFAVGDASGKRYLAMEYVEGEGLDRVLERAARDGDVLPWTRAVRLCADVARALDAAHERGVIHRDVKPSNILIAGDGRPLLLDFGLAREINERAVTLTRSFVGSPFYASPEQIGRGGGSLDGRTDLYSLGIVLYQCLTRSVPFSSGTLEQVLQSILTDEPPSVASLDASLPRDLSVVVSKAIAKDPARRYQTAGDLADDLEAVLERRPIAARPPGRVERAAMWARRRPAAATATGAALGTVLILLSVLTFQRVSEAQQRRAALGDALSEAESLLVEYASSREDSRDLEQQFEYRNRSRYTDYWTAAQDLELDELERKTRELRRDREQKFYRVLDLVREAERLGASAETGEAVLARLYVQRYLDAQLEVNPIEVAAYRELALEHDPAGAFLDSMRDGASLTVTTEVPGAEVFLFRREPAWVLDASAEPRDVLAPVNGPAPVPLHQWALRLTHAAGDLEAGDLVLELEGHPIRGSLFAAAAAGAVERFARLTTVDGAPVGSPWQLWQTEGMGDRRFVFERDGRRAEVICAGLDTAGIAAVPAWRLPDLEGARATIWSRGEVRQALLPAGVRVRPTASPAFLGEASFIGRSPIAGLPTYSGEHVVVVRAPGMETRRIVIHLDRQSESELRDITQLPLGTTPLGWVYVGTGRGSWNDVEPFWIMEREVTIEEYIEFLNHPETQTEIDNATAPIRYPRMAEPIVLRDADGTFRHAEGWSPAWPVTGIDWYDARAFAAWKTRRARERGEDWRFDLPRQIEWVIACGVGPRTVYPFGSTFRPKWVSSVRAKPMVAYDEPITYPIDQSALGVFDLSGCISEWTRSPWGDDGIAFLHAGGSYAHGEPTLFKSYGGNGLQPTQRSGAVGFRLVMWNGDP